MTDNKVKIRFNIMAILLIIGLAFALTPVTLQNDTFYTIKIGEHILENGITMQDPFSWHEGLIYTFPHWAYDVMIYFIYSIGGQLGIYLSTFALCAILGLTMYLTNRKLTKNELTSFVITIASMYLLKNYIAARAQLLTFILFLLTVFFIERFLDTGKKRYAIPLVIIPILIANLHSATFYFYFILYLPYIGEYVIYLLSKSGTWFNKLNINSLHKKVKKENNEEKLEELKKKIEELEKSEERAKIRREKQAKNPYKITINPSKHIKSLIVIMIICLFTGLLTPQTTFEPYTHFFKLMQGNTTQNISEHLPLTLANNVEYAVVLILFLIILTFTDTKIRLSDLFMLGGLTVLTFYTRRQESMFILMCSYIFNRLLCALFDKYDPTGCTEMKKWMTKILGMFVTIALVLAIVLQLYRPKIGAEYIDEREYPVQASDWILENLDVENIKLYNEYNFGSYLLFRGIPVFIDSRCDLYSPEFNGGRDIFSDFLKISRLDSTNIEEKIDEYDFDYLIGKQNSRLIIYLSQNPEEYKLVYPTGEIEDKYFRIYERVK